MEFYIQWLFYMKGRCYIMLDTMEKEVKLIIQGQYIGEITNENKTVSKFRLSEVTSENILTIVEEEYSGTELVNSVQYLDEEFSKDNVLQLSNRHFERVSFLVENVNPAKKSIFITQM